MGLMRVAVGMSGGVDSSVAALLVKGMGHEAVGVTMKVYGGGPAASAHGRRQLAQSKLREPRSATPPVKASNACYGPDEEKDVEEARAVCAALGIPHVEVDLRAEYRALVLDYFKGEYIRGRTPNPCVRCNQLVKFGLLFDRLCAGHEGGFDSFATGHYARVSRDPQRSRFILGKAADARKDQSYFLCMLSQVQLGRALFPLGEISKDEVRRIAREAGLSTWQKADSQNFAGGDYRSMLRGEAGEGGGYIRNGRGEILGTHGGIWSYTVGQRRGLRISGGEPLYVTGIERETNTVFVGPARELYHSHLLASRLNWVSIERPGEPLRAKARIRYQHAEADALVTPGDNDTAVVSFDEPQRSIAAGQWAVFYDGDELLGGGVIERSW